MSFSFPLYRADRIVKRIGPSIMLTQKTSTIDPVTGLEGSIQVNNYTLPGVVTTFESAVPTKEDIDSTIYQTIISAKNLTFTPKTSDVVTFNGTVYRVLKVEPDYIGSTISTWSLYLEA